MRAGFFVGSLDLRVENLPRFSFCDRYIPMFDKLLISALLLTGCATQSTQTGTKQISLEQSKVLFAGAYRSAFPSVSEDEALKRMMIMSESQAVYACVQQQAGYAGLVIVHSPIFEIRSYFKGDAAQKLSQCTDDANFKAIETLYSLADLEPKKDMAEAALREANIEFFSALVPFGSKTYDGTFVTSDGHVLISVAKNDVSRAEAVIAPLGLEMVYVREHMVDEIIVT